MKNVFIVIFFISFIFLPFLLVKNKFFNIQLNKVGYKDMVLYNNKYLLNKIKGILWIKQNTIQLLKNHSR